MMTAESTCFLPPGMLLSANITTYTRKKKTAALRRKKNDQRFSSVHHIQSVKNPAVEEDSLLKYRVVWNVSIISCVWHRRCRKHPGRQHVC